MGIKIYSLIIKLLLRNRESFLFYPLIFQQSIDYNQHHKYSFCSSCRGFVLWKMCVLSDVTSQCELIFNYSNTCLATWCSILAKIYTNGNNFSNETPIFTALSPLSHARLQREVFKAIRAQYFPSRSMILRREEQSGQETRHMSDLRHSGLEQANIRNWFPARPQLLNNDEKPLNNRQHFSLKSLNI